MTRVGVFGGGGRMGLEVCKAVAADPDLQLVAAVDPPTAGRDIGPLSGVEELNDFLISEHPDSLRDAGAQVAVDFTIASAAYENVMWCLKHGIHAVVGTTGLSEDQLSNIREAVKKADGINVVIAPNFAIGAVLMMNFAGQAAKWLHDAEIIELHHDGKKDAPSGTALQTLDRILAARGLPGPEPKVEESLVGARGGQREGVHVHSIRLPGLVAHQEVIFGGQGQTLTVRHDSTDRSSFMPGVVLAVKKVAETPGLTMGLDRILGLEK